MLGGRLNTTCLVVSQLNDVVIAAYSNSLYVFDRSQGHIIGRITIGQSTILTFSRTEGRDCDILTVVNSKGVLQILGYSKPDTITLHHKTTISRRQLKQVSIFSSETTAQAMYLIDTNNVLSHYEQKEITQVAQRIEKIFLVSEEYLVAADLAGNLQVYDRVNLTVKFQYSHNCFICAVEIYADSLIVGDTLGKILIMSGYLSDGLQSNILKYEWHPHEISCLKVVGSYLYSAGEEGVVVMWHLRENRRDFLPRIGCEIRNLFVHQQKVYCCLADNSIKLVDLGNEKSIVHYKVIVTPAICRSIQSRSLLTVQPTSSRLLMRSSAGHLQQIDLHSGVNNDVAIISRNHSSRLDDAYPNPHQVTCISLSTDGKTLAVFVTGITFRALMFFCRVDRQYRIVSRIEHPHRDQQVNFLEALQDNRFVTLCKLDSNLKLWKKITQAKKSLLQSEETYWHCEADLCYRGKLPVHLQIVQLNLIVTYPDEFLVVDVGGKSILKVNQMPQVKSHALKAVLALKGTEEDISQNYLVHCMSQVSHVKHANEGIKSAYTLISLSEAMSLDSKDIVLNKTRKEVAFLCNSPNRTQIFIYNAPKGIMVQHLIFYRSNQQHVTELSWFNEQLLAFDNHSLLYDLLGKGELLLLKRTQGKGEAEEIIEEETVMSSNEDYWLIEKRYLQQCCRRNSSKLELSLESMMVSSSLSASFQLLAKAMLI